MKTRRLFLQTLAGALLATLSASAQPAADAPRIAIVEQGGPVENIAIGGITAWDAFLTELRAEGRIEGQTLVVERWTAAGQDAEGFTRLIAAIVETGPDVIVARGIRAITALS